jgi:hypothetical protein
MTLGELDIWLILDILVLLLVALVPFLDLTASPNTWTSRAWR